MDKDSLWLKIQPNNFPMPPVMPPMIGIFPAGFCEEEVFLI